MYVCVLLFVRNMADRKDQSARSYLASIEGGIITGITAIICTAMICYGVQHGQSDAIRDLKERVNHCTTDYHDTVVKLATCRMESQYEHSELEKCTKRVGPINGEWCSYALEACRGLMHRQTAECYNAGVAVVIDREPEPSKLSD